MKERVFAGPVRGGIVAAVLCGVLALAPALAGQKPSGGNAGAGGADGTARSVSRHTQALLRATAARLAGLTTAGARRGRSGTAGHDARPAGSGGPAAAEGNAGAGHDRSGSLPYFSPETLRVLGAIEQRRDQANRFVRQGQWNAAVEGYVSVLNLSPSDQLALYGLAKCAAIADDIPDEIAFYRHAIYFLKGGFREGNPDVLMRFALLLSGYGLSQEALPVYRFALGNGLNHYADGKPRLRVLLPDFTEEQAATEPLKLQAMASVGIAESSILGPDDVLPNLQHALLLWPDSAVVNYYLGEAFDENNRPEQASAAYQRAWDLGGAEFRAAMSAELHREMPLFALQTDRPWLQVPPTPEQTNTTPPTATPAAQR